MKLWRTDIHYLLRLDRGEEVVSTLKEFSKTNNVKSGSIKGVGGVGPATLAFYDRLKKQYLTKTFNEEYELLSLLGNFSIFNNQPVAHCHAILSGEDFKAFGGHVMEMTVALTCELI